VWAALAYVGGVVGMVFAFVVVGILARAAFRLTLAPSVD